MSNLTTADSFGRFLDLASQDDTLGELASGHRVDPSFLGWIRAEFGSVENLVTRFGIDQATIAVLRRNLLTSAR